MVGRTGGNWTFVLVQVYWYLFVVISPFHWVFHLLHNIILFVNNMCSHKMYGSAKEFLSTPPSTTKMIIVKHILLEIGKDV